jgi:DNA primase catalytic core
MIEQAEIDRIKRETDLVKLVESSGVRLRRKGKQLVGLCPFHDDREPSLIVDPKKQLWNCLGACSEGGDVYKWVMKREGLSFKEAHQHLLRNAECGLRNEEPETPRGSSPSVQNYIWLERAVSHYHHRLLETAAAQDYLRRRGIRAPEFAVAFRVGYADGSLVGMLPAEGREALRAIGVLTESGRELMEGCVVFPLVDAGSGQVVNLYGRHIERPQHLYLPGPRRGVFNPRGARDVEEAILAESVIDAAAVWSAGLRNVLPIYGVNGLTDQIVEHLQSCRVSRVALMLDNDDAGRRAAETIKARLEAINRVVAMERIAITCCEA